MRHVSSQWFSMTRSGDTRVGQLENSTEYFGLTMGPDGVLVKIEWVAGTEDLYSVFISALTTNVWIVTDGSDTERSRESRECRLCSSTAETTLRLFWLTLRLLRCSLSNPSVIPRLVMTRRVISRSISHYYFDYFDYFVISILIHSFNVTKLTRSLALIG